MIWQYLIVTVGEKGDTIEALDSYGSEGWEAYHVQLAPGGSETFYFKRGFADRRKKDVKVKEERRG